MEFLATFLAWLPLAFILLALWTWIRHRTNPLVAGGFWLGWQSPVDLLAGFAICLLAVAGIFAIELMLGLLSTSWAQAGLTAIVTDLQTLVLAAVLEEVLFRSLMLSGLVILLRGNIWLALLVSAALFGASHLSNPGATLLGALSNGMGGFIYGAAFLATRAIWLPIGLHIGWNFGQALFGLPISGMVLPGLFSTFEIGDPLLTGGDYGPEAGLVGIAFRFVVLALLALYLSLGPGGLKRLTGLGHSPA